MKSTNNAAVAARASSDEITFESKNGYLVTVSDDRWRLSKDKEVPVGSVRSQLCPEQAEGFMRAIEHYAKEYSPSHVLNMALHLQHYLRSVGTDEVSVIGLTNYRASLTRETEYRLGSLKGFLVAWYELGYPGLESDVVEALKGWRLKGNRKGRAVKSLDPKVGPLDDIELEGLNAAAAQLFEQRKLALSGLAQVMLLTHLGSRPIQITHLKIKDLVLGKKEDGGEAFIVQMPQAKQRGAEVSFRGSVKPKKVARHLWEILQAQAKSVVGGVGRAVSPLSSETVGELPLFPNGRLRRNAAGCGSDAELKALLFNDQLHAPTSEINDALKKIVRCGRVHGRDGEPLRITAKRLRYTTGSRAAREGFGKWVIANLLDHADTQNAGVYTDNHPNFTAIIDKAMSSALAPLAQAYMGTLAGSRAEARFGDDPQQQITNGSAEIGVCGSHGYCGAVAPIACYTCMHFQPLLEAPHGEVLERLLAERERVKEYASAEDDVVVGATDRTILAVSQVILLCEERKARESGATRETEREHG